MSAEVMHSLLTLRYLRLARASDAAINDFLQKFADFPLQGLGPIEH